VRFQRGCDTVNYHVPCLAPWRMRPQTASAPGYPTRHSMARRGSNWQRRRKMYFAALSRQNPLSNLRAPELRGGEIFKMLDFSKRLPRAVVRPKLNSSSATRAQATRNQIVAPAPLLEGPLESVLECAFVVALRGSTNEAASQPLLGRLRRGFSVEEAG